MANISTFAWTLMLSAAFSAIVIWRILVSDEHRVFKIALSILALLPYIGPPAALWIKHFPAVQPRALQDQSRRHPDVFDRWRDTLSEKDPHRRREKWRKTMEENE